MSPDCSFKGWLFLKSILLPAVTLFLPPLFAEETPQLKLQVEREHLQKRGIGSTPEELLSYFRAFQRTPKQIQRISQLVQQLGDSSFTKRQQATRELLKLASVARVELEQAATTDDLEIRQRAKQILKSLSEENHQVLLDALRVYATSPVSGTSADLLALVPQCTTTYLQTALRDCIQGMIQPAEIPGLKKRISHAEPLEQTLLLEVLEKHQQEKLVPLLRTLLQEPSEKVQLTALRLLAGYHPLETLPGLLKLMDSETLTTRSHAAGLLRLITEQAFGFAAYDKPEKREVILKEWEEWIATASSTAKLRKPNQLANAKLGRMLLCTFNPHQGLEVDQNAKLHTYEGLSSPCGCQGLPNGHRVFANWGSQSVMEFDENNRLISTQKVPGTPNSLQRLPNGNTLVGLFHIQTVYEMRPDGSEIWRLKVKGNPTETRRLPTGNTLIALYGTNRVVEVNQKGEEVWAIEKVSSPESARRLPNGNTLVATSQSKVLEFSPAGKVVWSYEKLPQAYDALVLENGNLLIGHRGGLTEITRAGEVVQTRYPKMTVRRIDVY